MGAIDEELAKTWFKHECVLLRGVGESPYGGEGTPVPFNGFVRQSTRRVVTAQGEETVTETSVYSPLGLVAERGDMVELPTPFESGPWEITERTAHDGAGNQTPDHQRLILTIPGANPDEGEVAGPYG